MLALLLACVLPAQPASVVRISGSGSSFAAKVMSEGVFAYDLVNTTVSAQYTPSSSGKGRTALGNGDVDFCLTDAPFSTAQYQNASDLLMLPVVAAAVVPIFNVPGITTMELSLDQLARIFLGEIKYWNDPNITVRNPGLATVNQKIEIIVRKDASGTSLLFTSALAGANANFQSFNGATDRPLWKLRGANDTCSVYNQTDCACDANCYWGTFPFDTVPTVACHTEFPRITLEEQNLGVSGKVAALPYSIGYAVFTEAQSQGNSFVNLVSTNGRVILPTVEAVTHAMLEKGSRDVTPTTFLDISSPQNTRAWPMAGFSFLAIRANTTRPGTNCEQRAATVTFWLWFLRATVMRELARDNGFVVMPEIITTLTELDTTLKTVRCDDGNFALVEPPPEGLPSGGLSMGGVRSMLFYLLRVYNAEKPIAWSYYPSDQVQALQSVLSFTQLFSAAIPAFLPKQLRSTLAARNVRLIPVFLTGASPVYSFPSSAGLSNYTLVLDWEVLGGVFSGIITAWNDPQLSALNPSVTLPNASISVVVGNSESAAAFVDAMYRNSMTFKAVVDAALTSSSSSEIAYPFNWTWLFAGNNRQPPPSWTITSLDQNQASQLLIKQLEGYMSYRVANGPLTDGVTLVHQGVKMKFSVDGMTACFAASPVVEGPWTPAGPNCWPFTQLVTFSVFQSSSSTNNRLSVEPDRPCDSYETLRLLEWIFNSSYLGPGANAIGLGWLSEADRIANLETIYHFTCDGETFKPYPTIWVLPEAALAIVVTISVIGLVFSAISGVVLFFHRTELTWKKAGPQFMAIILLGLMLMYSSSIIFVVPATDGSCGLMYWLANIGFSCVYGPLFWKNLRIYRIFLGKQFKVRPLSNQRILLNIAAFLTIHCIILAVHQRISPFSAQTVERELTNKKTESITICTSDSWLFFIDLGYCASLLGANALLAFGVRHVDRVFNESKIIGLAVYNTILAIALGIVLISAIDLRGTGTIVLFGILACWVSSFVLCSHFLVKVRKVLLKRGDQGTDPTTMRGNLARDSKLTSVAVPDHRNSSAQPGKGHSDGSRGKRESTATTNSPVGSLAPESGGSVFSQGGGSVGGPEIELQTSTDGL